MSAGDFFNRWSKRKADVRAGHAVAPEPSLPTGPAPQPTPQPTPQVQPQVQPQVAPPTLEDASSLTIQSDFKPFMQGNVPANVKNLALKKLFADPHYNLMDGLDTYIDDYSKADPIPEAMLRRMVGAQLLNLFEETPAAPDDGVQIEATDGASSDVAPSVAVAHSDSADADTALSDPHDQSPDLQLQPNDAARCSGDQPGT